MAWYNTLNTTIIFVNVFLHLIGIYLLWKTHNPTTITTQQLFIFNISICEFFASFYWLVFDLLRLNGYEKTSKYIGYSQCVHVGLFEVLYMLMFALTCDRLMNIVIGLKYSIYWTVGNTKKLLIAFWITGIGCSVALVFVYYFKGFLWFWQTEAICFTLVQSISFILVSFVVYSAIFWKYKRSRESLRQFQISGPANGNNEHSSGLQIFRNSRFYVSILIILTFLLFNTIPYCFFHADDQKR